jgi:RNA recognition motif-containing protein
MKTSRNTPPVENEPDESLTSVDANFLTSKRKKPYDEDEYMTLFRRVRIKTSISLSSEVRDHLKIDAKRAIPHDEQERTSKMFVGGVSQEATEQNFKEYFQRFGRVVDAILMMDKDTGQNRGFGFVIFDSCRGMLKYTSRDSWQAHRGQESTTTRQYARGSRH